MRQLIGMLAAATVLAGCTAYSTLDPLQTSGAILSTEGSVTVKAVFEAGGYLEPEPPKWYRTAAVVPNLTKDSVDHLKVSLFSLEGQSETPMKDAEGKDLVKTLKADEAQQGVTLSRLTLGRSYRLKAVAYKASESGEPEAISSEATVDFALDKRNPTTTFTVRLKDVPFDGWADFPGFEITPSDELGHEGPIVVELPEQG